jgi:predicted pyridoxine 5'-phosphate oxidase superfamily flavin-nucleotide-binding protein
MTFYSGGQRAMQARFETTPLADRLEERVHRTAFTDSDRAFIEGTSFFFLATADAEGHPDCSYKGGSAGFVRVSGPGELIFPDYDGNGMFRSLGNIEANPHIGMLFIAMGAQPRRLRVNGQARVSLDDPRLADMPGAQALVIVAAEHIFPNCPRYIHDLASGSDSPYTPQAGAIPVEPGWKSSDDFKDVVPPRRV